MEELGAGQRNLVALGAALGSNCASCAEHYVGEARQGGLTDSQIQEAIRLADGVRRVPAQKVLDHAMGLLSRTVAPESQPAPEGKKSDPGRETAAAGEEAGAGTAPRRKPCCG